MQRQFRNHWAMTVLVGLCYFLVPHLAIFFMDFGDTAYAWAWSTEPLSGTLYLLFVILPILLIGGTLGIGHFLMDGDFSPALILEAAVGIATLFPRLPFENWMLLWLGVLFFGTMESFTLIKRIHPNSHPLLLGIAENRRFLAWLFWLSVGLMLVSRVCVDFGIHPMTISILAIGFFIGVVLPWLQLLEAPLTFGGLLGIISIGTLSLLLSFFLGFKHTAYTLATELGYGLLLAMEAVIWALRHVLSGIRRLLK